MSGFGQAQEYTLSLEEHATDIVAGQTTYRLYVNMVNSDDFLSSIYGGNDEPLSITTTTGFFNSAFGGAVASTINPAFLPFFPDLAADSWVTIGIEFQNTGDEVAISTVQSPDQPWTAHFESGTPEDGTDVYMNDETGGAWYVLNGTPNGLPDDNLQVLVLQMTTDGEICGTMNFQIFENGDGQFGDTRLTYTFCGVGTYSPDAEGGGCTDELACNYDAAATDDDGSCEYAETGYDCDGICLNDADDDGVCDEFEIAGCTDAFACNYDDTATDDDGTCEFVTCLGCTDESACNYDPTALYNDGSCDYSCTDVLGCTNVNACNFDPAATVDDGSCEYTSCVGCMDDTACNYDPTALYDNGSCEFPASGYDCDGNCLNDADMDGVCDEFEIQGCTDMGACNYDASATDDDGTCEYAEQYYDCDGVCLMDMDGDGVCDELEVAGCTDMLACNYDPSATNEDGSCEFAVSGYDCDGNCLNDSDMDGVCDEFEIDGCTDMNACNYDASATDDDGSCVYAEEFYDCDGNCLNDSDMDGVCDELEVNGCTDEMACNYSADATDDDGSCTYAETYYDCDGNCLNDADGDGICDEFEITGCTDPEAENYNEEATDDDGSCYYCDIAVTADSTDQTEDALGSISVVVSGGTAPYELAWTGPNDFTSTDEALQDLEAGTYTLVITDANGCTETIDVTINYIVGIAEFPELTFAIYPNPTNGSFWIEGDAINGKATLDILDAAGRLVIRQEMMFNGQPMQIAVPRVESGLYHVVLRSESLIGTTRLLIH